MVCHYQQLFRNPEFDKSGKNEDYTRTTYRLLDKGTLPTGDSDQQVEKSGEEKLCRC